MVPLALQYFATQAGRSQAVDFLNSLPVLKRAHIVADVEVCRIHVLKAPVSCKSIKGHRPMFKMGTGGFRSYCVVKA